MSLASRLRDLYARVPLGMRLGLEPMRAACARAGSPENAFPVVHVGGTNGKGSTSAMVESIARSSGLRTGLYTSPHLCRFAERIRIDGAPISDALLADRLDEALVEDLSFFETATLAAFLAFREAKVDLAVIEVGIGGRLDATNVIDRAKCTAITGVAFDHQDRLGDTLDLIAREKAAIARPGVPLVLGAMPDEARRAVLEIAQGARVVEASLPDDVVLGLEGPHQRANAAVAWTIAGELWLPERRKGLAEARWPGRFERIGDVILDGAHNPDGMRALRTALLDEPPASVIFGALEDKAWREMLDLLPDGERFYVAPKGRAPIAPARLAEMREGHATTLEEALAKAPRPTVICGSLYLVGEARARLLGLEIDPIVAL